MLTDEERQEIEAEFPKYADRKSVCIEAMKIVQHHRGWVADENIRDVAEYLGMSAEELESVASFYNMIYRKPVGRHVIHVCDSVSCWVMGYENLRATLTEKLGIKMGETTPDGRFTLLPVVCLGACDRAPVAMIDREAVMDFVPDKVDEVLARYK